MEGIMEADDIRKYGIGCGLLLLLLLCFIYVYPFIKRSNPAPVSKVDHEKTLPDKPSVAVPPKPQKTPEQVLGELSYGKDPAKAYELAIKYYREGTEEEKLAAIKMLPSLNMSLFENAYARKSYDEAMKIYNLNLEISGQCSKLDEKKIPYGLQDGIRYMKGRIQEMGVERFKEALASGDNGRINAEIDNAWKNPDALLPEKETLDYLVSLWGSASGKPDNSSAAEAALAKAADFAVQDVHSISYWKYRNGPLEEALTKRYQYKELVELGKKSLQSDRPVIALVYLSAAIKAISSSNNKTNIRVGTEEWCEIQKLFCESIVGTATLAEDGKLRWLPPDNNFENKVEILLQIAARSSAEAAGKDKGAKSPEIKYAVTIKAWDELLRLYLNKLHRIVRTQEPHRIISYCDERLYDGACSYITFLADCYGPEKVLASLPEKMKSELDKNVKTPKEKVFAVTELMRAKKYSPQFTGKEEFLKASLKAKYELATNLLSKGKYPEAFMYSREILREYPDGNESTEIRKQIISKIDEAGNSKNFNAVYYLASFLIGEMKKATLAPDIARKLAECLEGAAESYREKSPIKRAFMLSLMSDVLFGTEKGISARDEAMKTGFEAVKKLPFKAQEKPALTLPSTLKGFSIEAVRNSTPYHLLAFYDGSEKFFVRMNPYSKGSLALADGEYEIAVIVTSDNVVPYRTKIKYEKEFILNKYFISEPGRAKSGEYSDEFMGKFGILRVPKGLENAAVEPESGVIFQSRVQ
jgi:tetratricopeptide (TPR) repeat protein